MLIHFNIATYIDGDGCEGQTVPNITLFNPYLLNTDNWVQTMQDFGAQYAVLVGKVIPFVLLTVRVSSVFSADHLSMLAAFSWRRPMLNSR
jgi:hypothetical protein